MTLLHLPFEEGPERTARPDPHNSNPKLSIRFRAHPPVVAVSGEAVSGSCAGGVTGGVTGAPPAPAPSPVHGAGAP